MSLTDKQFTITKGNITTSLIEGLKSRNIEDMTAARVGIELISSLPKEYLNDGNLLKAFFYDLAIVSKCITDELPEEF